MTNQQYITTHRTDDVRALALKKAPEDVDHKWCLQQIEGWQLAQKKLPTWAAADGLHYPPRLSMEQCSSHWTAQYKRELINNILPPPRGRDGVGSSLADLTGGLGVDFSYLAPLFDEAVYCERLPHLCELARHNFPLLGCGHATVLEGEGEQLLDGTRHYTLLYIDPARRDGAGRKTVAIADCTPDVAALYPRLTAQCDTLLIKLSPMLDIADALRALPDAAEVHVVSVNGECKELLIVVRPRSAETKVTYVCAELGNRTAVHTFPAHPTLCAQHIAHPAIQGVGEFLFEPSSAILKAGVQDALCERYGIRKLHPMSHLFVGNRYIEDFPGRVFRMVSVGDFSKQSLRQQLGDLRQANITVRNFPQSVDVLRKKLKLGEGGSAYLFATTLSDGSHALIRCEKVKLC